MTTGEKVWIKSMEVCAKYWGCHQMPERSFFIKGYQMPVCARCFGIMVGELAGVLLAFWISVPVWMPALLMCPMIADGLIQYKTRYRSKNHRRFLTGLLFGASFTYLIASGIIKIFT